MKIKFMIVMMVLLVGMITYHPVVASGIVTTCDETSLVTALAGGGVVDFNIGMDCEIIFTSEKVISVDTTVQNISANAVVFNGNDLTRFFTVNKGVSLTLDNLTLQNGSAVFSGAIYNNEGILNIKNSSFIANNSTEFSYNPRSGDVRGGGAIYNFHGSLEVSNTIFDSNATATDGSAIYSVGLTDNLITNNTFSHNHSGSAIFIRPEYFVSIGYGEGVSIRAVIVNNTFSKNDDIDLQIIDATTEIRDNTFDNDNDILRNGLIYEGYGGNSVSIINNIFRNYLVTPLTVSVANFREFLTTSVRISIQRNRFIDNTSESSCSGILLTSGGSRVVYLGFIAGDISNNVFYGNSSPIDNAAICTSINVYLNLDHNTFFNNNTPTGNNLLVAITETMRNDTTVTARGNIFQDGSCIIAPDAIFIDGGNNIAYNAVGCVGTNVDPQLNPISNDALVPAPTSPAVNAYLPPCAVSDDQFGTVRPLDGMCDIGAIEGVTVPDNRDDL